jgi:DNA-directed RNA polymerase beta' subunit
MTPEAASFEQLLAVFAAPDRHFEGLVAFYTPPPRGRLAALLGAVHVPSSEQILEWSYGAITREADLESERIFGPRRSFVCACLRYRGRDYRGMVCERCGVELIESSPRTFRAGHIALSRPVLHPWYARAASLLLGMTLPALYHVPAAQVRQRLRELDLHAMDYQVERALEHTRSERTRIRLEARRSLAAAFRDAGYPARPENLVLEYLPVTPPDPEIDLFKRRGRAIRSALASIVAPGSEPETAVAALFALFRR